MNRRRCSYEALNRIRLFLITSGMILACCYIQVHPAPPELTTHTDSPIGFPNTQDRILEKLKLKQARSTDTMEAVRRGTALTSIRNDIRKAFITQDYNRVIELSEIIKSEYPNQQLNLFYETAAQIRMSDRENNASKSYTYPRLADTAPQLPDDTPVVEIPGLSGSADLPDEMGQGAVPSLITFKSTQPHGDKKTNNTDIRDPAETGDPMEKFDGGIEVAAVFTPVPMLTPIPVASITNEPPDAGGEADIPGSSGHDVDERIVAMMATPVPVIPQSPVTQPVRENNDLSGGLGDIQTKVGIILAITCFLVLVLVLIRIKLRPDEYDQLEGTAAATSGGSTRLLDADDEVSDEPVHKSAVAPEPSTVPDRNVQDEPTESFSTIEVDAPGATDEFETEPAPLPTERAWKEKDHATEHIDETDSISISTRDFSLDDIEINDEDNVPGYEPDTGDHISISYDMDDSDILRSEDIQSALEIEAEDQEAESRDIAASEPAAPDEMNSDDLVEDLSSASIQHSRLTREKDQDEIQTSASSEVWDEYDQDNKDERDELSGISLEDTPAKDSLLDKATASHPGPSAPPEEKMDDVIDLGDVEASDDGSSVDNSDVDMDDDTKTSWEELGNQSTCGLAKSSEQSASKSEYQPTEMKSFSIDETVVINLNADPPSSKAEETGPSLTAGRLGSEPAPPPPPETAVTEGERLSGTSGLHEELIEPFSVLDNAEPESAETIGLGEESPDDDQTIQASPDVEVTQTQGTSSSQASYSPKSLSSGTNLFDRELHQGMHAFNAGDWIPAHHHLSIAAALKPDNREVKEYLRQARAKKEKIN
jgi:hypothetical protein